jgi:signal transduction histidine kinase
MTALEQAQALLEELLQAARSGAIIPVRLPGQIAAIHELLAQAKDEQKVEQNQPPADVDGHRKEQAYFIGHAIHELRTPMTSIRGYA